MIVNLRHQGIRHLATLGAAGVQVFSGVSRVNVCVTVHCQGLHHGGDAGDLPQGVQVQVREKAVGGELHSNTGFIVRTAFQRSRLFIQGLCRGKEAWKLEESLVGSVEVPLPGPQLCLQIDQKVEEINLYISDFLTPTSERLFGTLRPSASNPKAPTYLLERDYFIQTQCVLWKMLWKIFLSIKICERALHFQKSYLELPLRHEGSLSGKANKSGITDDTK